MATEALLRGEGVEGDGEKEWFCKPEGVVAEAWSCPGAEDCSAEKTETDETQGAGLGEATFADPGGGVKGQGVVEAFGYVAKVAGDEGGVVRKAVHAAEACDLDGCDVGDDAGECHLRKAERRPAEGEDGSYLQSQAEERGADAEAGAQVFGGDDSG